MSRLAVRMLRHRPGSALATLIALAVGAMILTAMGVLVESGLSFRPAPDRYAAADVVVARPDTTFTSREFGGDTVTSTVPLPEGGTLPAGLAEQVRAVPGVAEVAVEESPPGRVVALAVTAAPGTDVGALRSASEGVAAGSAVLAGDDRGRAERRADRAAASLLVLIGASFGGYVVLLIVFVVAATVGLSVRHRRRDLALLRAVAATPGQIRRMLTAEAAVVSFAGAVIGVPAGLAAAHWLTGELTTRGFLTPGFPMVPGLLAAPAAVLVIALSAVLAALVAARRVTTIRPVEALGEANAEPAEPGRVRLISGLVTLAGAVSAGGTALIATGQTAMGAAVGMLYLFVLAVALLAPWINRAAAPLLTPMLRRSAPAHQAAANMHPNPRRMATVLTSLVLAVGFGGSVWFLQDNLERQAVADSRDGTIAGHALVSPAGLPSSATVDLQAVPGVTAVTPVVRTSVIAKFYTDAQVLAARAVDPRSLPSTLDLDVGEGDLTQLGDGTVAVSRMQATAMSWDVGDEIEMRLGDGTPIRPRVVAIYDRGLGFGDVILDRSTVAGHTATGLDSEILVLGGSTVALREVAARYPGSTVVDAAGMTGGLATDLALSAWLNRLLIGVMVGYAALAAANTMVMAALSRRREIAVLRLAGVTRAQVRRMVRWEQAGLLGSAVLIGGSIAGLTLTAVVFAVTGRPVPYVPALGVVAVLGGAAVLALATTVVPIGRLLRVPPVAQIGLRE